jgi:antitoxin component YwqK of YwqJK toxin-antitoxin module
MQHSTLLRKTNKGAYLIAIACLLVFWACGTDSKEVVQNYGTGEVSRRHTEINGKKEGKMIEYYKDGAVKGERLFENDIQVGKTIYYYPNGKIKEVQYYEEGKLHGGDTVFYENGKPQFLRNFNLGVLHGYIRKWNTDDSLIYEARYSNDTLVEVKGQSVHPDSLIRE